MSDDHKDTNAVASLDGDESGMGVSQIKLISKDQKEFLVDKRYAFVSNLIKTSLEHGQEHTQRNTARARPRTGTRTDRQAESKHSGNQEWTGRSRTATATEAGASARGSAYPSFLVSSWPNRARAPLLLLPLLGFASPALIPHRRCLLSVSAAFPLDRRRAVCCCLAVVSLVSPSFQIPPRPRFPCLE